jgi:hypothetical protein
LAGQGTDTETAGAIERRLRAAGELCDSLRTELEDELEARDRIILEAIDLGWGRSQVARWAKVSNTRITQVIARRAVEP